MRKYRFLLYIALLNVLLYSCYKEDAIIPSSTEESERFTFPQGNSTFDQKIKTVHDNFGVKIIYKDFKNSDFSLSWTTAAGSRLGYDVSASQQENAVNFVVDNIFNLITPEISKQVLPPYFYVADSVANFSTSTRVFEVLNPVYYIYNGLDFWSFTWDGAKGYNKILTTNVITYLPISNHPKTSFMTFYKRGVILKEIFKIAVNKEKIKVPADFNTGFDFLTATINTTGSENHVNYYKKRGFPGQMTSLENFNISTLALITKTSAKQNFIDYLHLCMRYTPDSIEINYPIAKFPLIHQKYPLVVKYMQEKYNIDLNKIATKPQP